VKVVCLLLLIYALPLLVTNPISQNPFCGSDDQLIMRWGIWKPRNGLIIITSIQDNIDYDLIFSEFVSILSDDF
jgi:hypothetical protein